MWRWTFVILAVPALLVVRLPPQAARVAPILLVATDEVVEANRSLNILVSNTLDATRGAPSPRT